MTAQHSRTRRPFLPQGRREWLAIPKALCILALIGIALLWLQGYLDKLSSTVLLLLVLVAEPLLRKRHADVAKDSAHGPEHGRMAIVTRACAPIGRVQLDGTSWAAKSLDDRQLESGECVYVHGGQGLLLHVSRAEPSV